MLRLIAAELGWVIVIFQKVVNVDLQISSVFNFSFAWSRLRIFNALFFNTISLIKGEYVFINFVFVTVQSIDNIRYWDRLFIIVWLKFTKSLHLV